MAIPDNKTFVEQTADYLRERILSGQWGLVLPSERELASQIQVARNTLRKAISILNQEGLLYVIEGERKHRIRLPEGVASNASSKPPSKVVLLTNVPLDELPSHTLLRADLMRRTLSNSGIEFRVLSSRAFRLARPAVALRELTEAYPDSIWILHHATEPIQRWFQSSAVKCVVFGTAYPGIDLPGFSVDLAASMRHAMGLLRRKGHTSLVLVEPERILAGHLLVRSVMDEQAGHWDRVQSLVWNGNHSTFPGAVKRLMASVQPPSAFILMTSTQAMALYSTFCNLGLRIPADASVVALFDDPLLAHIIPQVAHYRENAEVESKRIVTMIRHALRGAIPTHSTTLLQEFIPGGSVAPPPPS